MQLGAMALLLQRTKLGEGYVLALAAVVAAAAAVAMSRRTSDRAVRRWFAAVSVTGLAVLAALAAARFRTFQRITEEDHLLEWLTAECLLAGSLVGVALAGRLARRGRAAPMTVFLTAGYMTAFCRELEFGQPFFGEKIWYSRNLFRLEAYLDPSYLPGEFSRSLELTAPASYPAHLVLSAVALVTAAVVTAYLIRHRKAFAARLGELHRQAYGRWFLVGVGVFVGTQPLGRAFERLLKSPWLRAWRRHMYVSHRVLDEPLETWAAMCLLMGMILLWRSSRRGEGQALADEPAA